MIIQFLKDSKSPAIIEAVKFYKHILNEMIEQKRSEMDVDFTGIENIGEIFAEIVAQLEDKRKIINESLRGHRTKRI